MIELRHRRFRTLRGKCIAWNALHEIFHTEAAMRGLVLFRHSQGTRGAESTLPHFPTKIRNMGH